MPHPDATSSPATVTDAGNRHHRTQPMARPSAGNRHHRTPSHRPALTPATITDIDTPSQWPVPTPATVTDTPSPGPGLIGPG